MLGELLRGDVAAGVQAALEIARGAEVVQVGAEIGAVVVVGDALLDPADLGELDALVERDLGLGGRQLEGGV